MPIAASLLVSITALSPLLEPANNLQRSGSGFPRILAPLPRDLADHKRVFDAREAWHSFASLHACRTGLARLDPSLEQLLQNVLMISPTTCATICKRRWRRYLQRAGAAWPWLGSQPLPSSFGVDAVQVSRTLKPAQVQSLPFDF